MLVAAPYITPKEAHINALFLQPTPWCARNCPGCYAKTFQGSPNFHLFHEILNSLNNKTVFTANQITFAFDKLPEENTGDRAEMQYLGSSFLWKGINHLDKVNFSGEWHGTTHHLDDLLPYLPSVPYDSIVDGAVYGEESFLSVLSITNIDLSTTDKFPAIRRSLAKHINWNCTVFPGYSLKKLQENFELIAGEVDSVYLVLHKPSTGQHIDATSWEAHLEMRKFIKTLPEDIQKKVMTDGCIGDSARYLKTGYGCSSNVSRFQVWPDGSVTGCPYKQTPTTPPTSTLPGLLQNIYDASKVYEFERCKIPHKVDPKNPRVNTRNHLEIID